MQKAEVLFAKVLADCWRHFFYRKGLRLPVIHICTMKTRWGSMSPKGRMTLNLLLIQTARECIEYVVIHELCHLVHPNHSRDFYRLQEQVLPDWAQRKQKLERTLA